MRPAYKLAVFAFSLAALANPGPSADSTFMRLADSLFTVPNEKHLTEVTHTRGKTVTYRSVTVKTIPRPVSEVAEVLYDLGNYPDVFDYMRQCEWITYPADSNSTGTVFISMGVWIAVSWFICDAYRELPEDTRDVFMYAMQNKDSTMEETHRKRVKGMFKVGYHDFRMWFHLRDLGDEKTRIALVAIVRPRKWIPAWLFRIVSKRVFPGMLTNIEEHLSETRDPEKP